jgi:hypothetical protein
MDGEGVRARELLDELRPARVAERANQLVDDGADEVDAPFLHDRRAERLLEDSPVARVLGRIHHADGVPERGAEGRLERPVGEAHGIVEDLVDTGEREHHVVGRCPFTIE